MNVSLDIKINKIYLNFFSIRYLLRVEDKWGFILTNVFWSPPFNTFCTCFGISCWCDGIMRSSQISTSPIFLSVLLQYLRVGLTVSDTIYSVIVVKALFQICPNLNVILVIVVLYDWQDQCWGLLLHLTFIRKPTLVDSELSDAFSVQSFAIY